MSYYGNPTRQPIPAGQREYYVYMKDSGRKVGEVMAASEYEARTIVARRNGYTASKLEAHA